MKKILLLICLYSFFYSSIAQVSSSQNSSRKFTQFSIRGGIDNATKQNFSNYVTMPLKGFGTGISFDKYWKWYGLGVDVDFLANEKPIYIDTDLITKLGGNVPGSWYNTFLTTSTSSTKLTRAFIGIGPSVKAQTNNAKFVAELNLRGGITYTKGSALTYSTKGNPGFEPFFTRDGSAVSFPTSQWHTFNHDGYTNDIIATVKAQLRLNYFVTSKIGINIGAYYMHYFGSAAKYDYLDVSTPQFAPVYWSYFNPISKTSALSSVGFSGGISYRIMGIESKKESVSKNNLTVTVKDELTKLPIQHAIVTIVGANGNALTGTTDVKGVMSFKKLASGNYTVSGLLNGIATDQQTALVGNGNKNTTVSLTHNDPRFTVVGKAINITKNAPEPDVNVSLKNNAIGAVKMGKSQAATGEFNFQLDANSDYELVGKKANYISNIANISTKGLTRSQTLYVQLELGVQEVEVGKAIALQNVYYDLDKSNIKETASTDLKKVAQFMLDNPNQVIEISSHTDARGSDEYNLKLSQDRAQAIVNYLVAKGIDKNKLKAIGYGETKLVNGCGNGVTCTDDQHQANRRTELVAVSQ